MMDEEVTVTQKYYVLEPQVMAQYCTLIEALHYMAFGMLPKLILTSNPKYMKKYGLLDDNSHARLLDNKYVIELEMYDEVLLPLEKYPRSIFKKLKIDCTELVNIKKMLEHKSYDKNNEAHYYFSRGAYSGDDGVRDIGTIYFADADDYESLQKESDLIEGQQKAFQEQKQSFFEAVKEQTKKYKGKLIKLMNKDSSLYKFHFTTLNPYYCPICNNADSPPTITDEEFFLRTCECIVIKKGVFASSDIDWEQSSIRVYNQEDIYYRVLINIDQLVKSTEEKEEWRKVNFTKYKHQLLVEQDNDMSIPITLSFNKENAKENGSKGGKAQASKTKDFRHYCINEYKKRKENSSELNPISNKSIANNIAEYLFNNKDILREKDIDINLRKGQLEDKIYNIINNGS